MNIAYFHKKVQDILWRNNVKEIKVDNGETLNNFDKISEEAYVHFNDLYLEKGVEPKVTTTMMENIPKNVMGQMDLLSIFIGSIGILSYMI
jgi:hypothetical protein